jgi:hypothetical protein
VNTTVTASPATPPRTRPTRSKEPTNLYLEKDLKAPASAAAISRYNLSLSDLVNELLKRELGRKGGILHAKFANR